MSKILGLDLGTNSIGWAVVETTDNKIFKLLEKGVHIFQEGVKIEKGIEGSKSAERTGYRSARRLKYRRKLRKIETIKVLIKYGLCPTLSDDELLGWKNKKVYPTNEAFRLWLSTDDRINKNPYYYRKIVVEQKLDLSNSEDCYKIGRAFYHITQRRGFLSNRLATTKESDGAVKNQIAQISEAKGDQTLGQYFYDLNQTGERVRAHYTHRDEHYLQEFNKICEVQLLPDEWKCELVKAIFYQRPLKSQKGLVGNCPFETNKPRCPVSHPAFEEYRMLCFVNNIKIKTPNDDKLRFLNEEERQKIFPVFFRKSKEHFDFEDIAKQLAPKKQYRFFKDGNKQPEDYLFNYSMNTTITGCTVSARFASIFGSEWQQLKINYVREKDGKSSFIDINDVWHVLFTFNDIDKLVQFGSNRLRLNEEQADEFIHITLKKDYASLSLKAINKILPYLRKGLIYSHAVFLANMSEAIPPEIWDNDENKEIISREIYNIIENQNEERLLLEVVNGLIKTNRTNKWTWSDESEQLYYSDIERKLIDSFGQNKWDRFDNEYKNRILNQANYLFKKHMQLKGGLGDFVKARRIDEQVKEFITDNFQSINGNLSKLYHPSAIDVYKQPIKAADGNLYLGSPMVASVRNPMAMRALHQLRKLINELIRQEMIDATTKINIEMARDLKNANERKALQDWQRDRENLHKEYASRIKEYFVATGITREPSEDDILKYQLWEEQERVCLYTGETIGIADFLDADPKFDIEHTLPRSQSFDNSQENKTLCNSRFNREVKRTRLPSELANHQEILIRIKKWNDKVEELNKQIEIQIKRARGVATKEAKDSAIQRRHKLTIERDYWRNKYQRFIMTEIKSGFKNSQLVDTGIITKYSRLYLQTLFSKVYTVKGNTVADFRKIWGLQSAYHKKVRVNHIHHCIDAITMACISKENYENLAKFYHDWEQIDRAKTYEKPHVDKPWPTFTEDLSILEQQILVSHHTPDTLPKQSKKKLRKRGKVQLNKSGEPIYQQGDTVRASLHKETFYGAIKRNVVNKKGENEEKVLYVVRKPIDSLSAADVTTIVDEVVRQKVQQAIDEKGLKKALSEPIWMNEEKLIPIKKVRCFTPSVTNPIALKPHRDKSTKEYKQSYHVTNDGNYLMAIYEGQDNKGKLKRDFEIVSNLKAAEYFKLSTQKVLSPQGFKKLEGLVPGYKVSGIEELPLKCVLKTGTLILFWNKTPEEIWELDKNELYKRLYKLTQFEGDGRIQARFHQVAKPDNELERASVLDFMQVEEKVRLSKGNLNMLVESVDFKINILGQIQKI